VPDGDRLRLADAVTWQLCLLPLGAALYARLVSWGWAPAGAHAVLLLSISYSHSRLLGGGERFVIFVSLSLYVPLRVSTRTRVIARLDMQ
jgi:hypothetical protein